MGSGQAHCAARHATLLQAVISVLAAAPVAALLPGFRGWLIALGVLLRLLQHLPAASLWPDIA